MNSFLSLLLKGWTETTLRVIPQNGYDPFRLINPSILVIYQFIAYGEVAPEQFSHSQTYPRSSPFGRTHPNNLVKC